MLSIITAVHNQLAMNRLFLENLKRYSSLQHQLVVIDNCSTDGSAEFFEQQGATVIRNERNYSYPHSQNQGIRASQYEYLAFLNNDLIVSKEWDRRAIQIFESNKLDIASWCSTDRCESQEATVAASRKWKRIRNPLLFLFGPRYLNLKIMHRWMYGDWDQWIDDRYAKFGSTTKEGFTGCALLTTKKVLDKLGWWDETIQAADFDLFLRTKERSLIRGDVKPIQLMLGVYLHHFVRLTYKSRVPAFADSAQLSDVETKWGKENVNRLLVDTDVRI
jgi:GT2 family glycosyltransferase